MTAPLKYRMLQAEMKIKALTLTALAKKAKMNKSTASNILSGRYDNPLKFAKLKAMVERSPMPVEPTHV